MIALKDKLFKTLVILSFILPSLVLVAYAAVQEGTFGHVTVVRIVNATEFVDAHDYFFRGYNVTAFFIAVMEALENFTMPDVVFEETVEWGLVYGTTGDWFNHSLPGEPVYIGLEMHPDTLTYDNALIFPRVYDKTDSQWQLALYFYNGTQVADDHDMLVMYHMRWEVGLVDPNEPQLPAEGQGPPV